MLYYRSVQYILFQELCLKNFSSNSMTDLDFHSTTQMPLLVKTPN
jgi:hypothetical protein